jgi:hypothetical protein
MIMFSMRNALGTPLLVSLLALGACSSNQDGSDQQAKVSSATAPVAVSGTPLTADQVNVKLTLVGTPVLTADGKNIDVSVNLANDGKTVLSSASKPPVNLGAHSVDATGKDIADLSRAALPAIAPGTSAAVTISLPVVGTLGHSVQIMPLQENVAWFNAWGTKPVTVGPFNSCSDAAQGKVCDADGKPLAIMPAH